MYYSHRLAVCFLLHNWQDIRNNGIAKAWMSYNFYLTIKWMKRKCKYLHCRKNSSYIYESEYYRDLEGGLFYLETVNNHPQHCGNHLITSYTVKKKVYFFTEKESKTQYIQWKNCNKKKKNNNNNITLYVILLCNTVKFMLLEARMN